MVIYIIQKNGGKDNSTDSLNVMESYHYHSENRVITRQFPSMPSTCLLSKHDRVRSNEVDLRDRI